MRNAREDENARDAVAKVDGMTFLHWTLVARGGTGRNEGRMKFDRFADRMSKTQPLNYSNSNVSAKQEILQVRHLSTLAMNALTTVVNKRECFLVGRQMR